MTPTQHKLLWAANDHAIREPARGAYRRPGGEVDNVRCFNSRSIKAALDKGWIAERPHIGGYVITEAGRTALAAL